MKDKIKEKETARLKWIIGRSKKERRRTFIYGKHALYFEFLKHFIDSYFVKTVQRISF